MDKLQINQKLKIPVFFLLAFALFLLPSVSALTIDNTTFHSSISNYTIFVDSMTLSEVNVTNLTISFYDVNSTGTNLTNTNLTYNSRADFYGLAIGLTIRNINTSTDLFTSASGNQDYNATFTTEQVLRITGNITENGDYVCSSADRALLNLTTLFFALLILALPLGILFHNGTLSTDMNVKKLLIVFIGVILGIIFIQEIANSVFAFCG